MVKSKETSQQAFAFPTFNYYCDAIKLILSWEMPSDSNVLPVETQITTIKK